MDEGEVAFTLYVATKFKRLFLTFQGEFSTINHRDRCRNQAQGILQNTRVKMLELNIYFAMLILTPNESWKACSFA